MHVPVNTGYAIEPLERLFFEVAKEICDGEARVHFAFPSLDGGHPRSLPWHFRNIVKIDASSTDSGHIRNSGEYIKRNRIDAILGFDQPVKRPIYKEFRNCGVQKFISYWGAPMSSLMHPAILVAKKIEVLLSRVGPDHYIFESHGMAETAARGRGISPRNISIVPLGVNVRRYRPDATDRWYAHDVFNISRQRRLIYYSGHMEERKGVSVIMRAANRLVQTRAADDWHFVLFGNRGGEADAHLSLLSEAARSRVSFLGYRNDLDRVQRSCYAAVIASTGWDSLTLTALETQASCLPLIASDLAGLNEAVDLNRTGFLFAPGNEIELSERLLALLSDPDLRDSMGSEARARIEASFTVELQKSRLISVLRQNL